MEQILLSSLILIITLRTAKNRQRCEMSRLKQKVICYFRNCKTERYFKMMSISILLNLIEVRPLIMFQY
jgi:hypothetical protein